MRHAPRRVGFYWVRFEGVPIVAEFTDGRGCTEERRHWHIPGSSECWRGREVCELLSEFPLRIPRQVFEAAIFIDPHEVGTDIGTSPDQRKKERGENKGMENNGIGDRLTKLEERHEALAQSVQLFHIDLKAYTDKLDVYIRQNDQRLKRIEDNHSLLIQLVDGQQTRLARLEDRLEGGR